MRIKCGDIFFAECSSSEGSSIIKGYRPVIVIRALEGSTVLHVIPLTSRNKRPISQLHVPIVGHGLKHLSVALVEQLRLIDKSLLGKRIGNLSGSAEMERILKHLTSYLNPQAA